MSMGKTAITCVGCAGDGALCNCTSPNLAQFSIAENEAPEMRISYETEPVNLPCPEDTGESHPHEQWCN